MQILGYNGNIMNMFQAKSLKLQCEKQPGRIKKNTTPFRLIKDF